MWVIAAMVAGCGGALYPDWSGSCADPSAEQTADPADALDIELHPEGPADAITGSSTIRWQGQTYRGAVSGTLVGSHVALTVDASGDTFVFDGELGGADDMIHGQCTTPTGD